MKRKRIKVNIIKFRKYWLDNDDFSDWLLPLDHDDQKAFCSYCCCELQAKSTSLQQHLQSSKHCRMVLNFPDRKVDKANMPSKGPSKKIETSRLMKRQNINARNYKIKPELLKFLEAKENAEEKKQNKKLYPQKFRQIWLQEEQFCDWLIEVKGDSSKAYCTYCRCKLGANHSFLKYHSQTNKHIRNINKCPERKLLKNIKSEHIAEPVGNKEILNLDCKKKYPQKFRKTWLRNSKFSGWLQEVKDDPSKAFCVFCCRELMAKLSSLVEHYSTRSHLINMSNHPERGVFHKFSNPNSVVEGTFSFDFDHLTSPTPAANNVIQNRISSFPKRQWHSNGTEIHPHNLMYPVFIVDDPNSTFSFSCLPDVYQYGVSRLGDMLEPLVAQGLMSVILYPACCLMKQNMYKSTGNNPMILAIKKIKELYPHLTVASDVCLCSFASHKHSRITESKSLINKQKTLELALDYAHAGANILAISSIIDDHITSTKLALQRAGLTRQVSILSYTTKFDSSLCQEFIEIGKLKTDSRYGKQHADPFFPILKTAERDIAEGTDMILVMPALPLLDIVRQIKKKHSSTLVFSFQASGEYEMLNHGASNGCMDLQSAVLEVFTSMRRAGVDVIISYFTPLILSYLMQN